MTLHYDTIYDEIKVITFDLDDTLWPVRPALEKAQTETQKWLTENANKLTETFTPQDIYKKSIELCKENAKYTHQISQLRIATIQQLSQLVGYSETQAREIAEQAFLVFIQHRQQVNAYDGIDKALKFLSKKFLLGSITNGNADIKKTNLSHYFTFSVSAEEINASKPNPIIFKAAYHKAIHLLDGQLSLHQILHVGDDYEKDIIGAQNAGFKTAWIDKLNKKENQTSHNNNAHFTINSVSELHENIESTEK